MSAPKSPKEAALRQYYHASDAVADAERKLAAALSHQADAWRALIYAGYQGDEIDALYDASRLIRKTGAR